MENEKEYLKIKEYIKNNPKMENRDRNNIVKKIEMAENNTTPMGS